MTRVCRCSVRPTSSSTSSSRPRVRVVAAEQLDRLLHRQVGLDAGLLQHDADALLKARSCLAGVEAEHADLAAVRAAVALEDLDRRRLAGAVRPEQREDLAARDAQVDARTASRSPYALRRPRTSIAASAFTSDVIL